MDTRAALSAFAALSQETRLAIFRLLLQRGCRGLTSGEVGQRLGLLPSTASVNLAVLLAAGLVRRRREGREMRYFAELEGMRGLLSFLMEDCCGGAPEDCLPVLDALTGVA